MYNPAADSDADAAAVNALSVCAMLTPTHHTPIATRTVATSTAAPDSRHMVLIYWILYSMIRGWTGVQRGIWQIRRNPVAAGILCNRWRYLPKGSYQLANDGGGGSGAVEAEIWRCRQAQSSWKGIQFSWVVIRLKYERNFSLLITGFGCCAAIAQCTF